VTVKLKAGDGEKAASGVEPVDVVRIQRLNALRTALVIGGLGAAASWYVGLIDPTWT